MSERENKQPHSYMTVRNSQRYPSHAPAAFFVPRSYLLHSGCGPGSWVHVISGVVLFWAVVIHGLIISRVQAHLGVQALASSDFLDALPGLRFATAPIRVLERQRELLFSPLSNITGYRTLCSQLTGQPKTTSRISAAVSHSVMRDLCEWRGPGALPAPYGDPLRQVDRHTASMFAISRIILDFNKTRRAEA